MFEKEAERCADEYRTSDDYSSAEPYDIGYANGLVIGFQKGAEFGYNKANEWHYPSKGEYPKECENVWCYCKGAGIKFCCVGHTIINGDNKIKWWASNKSEELSVIAWKEIVLPELKESE